LKKPVAAEQPLRRGVGGDLGIVPAVAAALRGQRITTRVPGEAQPRRDVARRVGQALAVVAQADIHDQVAAQAVVVLGEQRPDLLAHRIVRIAEALGEPLHLGEGQLRGRNRRRDAGLEGELAEHERRAELLPVAARARVLEVAAELEEMIAERQRQRVSALQLPVGEPREA
jgi:hypothetical protein